MTAKTKKYQLTKKQYLKVAFYLLFKRKWYYMLIPLALCAFTHLTIWFLIVGLSGFVLYLIFWLVQFLGVTQMPDSKMMFEKYAYDINSQQITMKINPKQGMPVKWDMIKQAYKTNKGFILMFSPGQFFYLPYSIFNSNNDLRLMETILKRKELLK